MITYIKRNARYALPWKWGAGAKALFRKFTGSGILFTKADVGMASLLPVKKVDLAVSLVRPRTVLDVGCGTGRVAGYLLRQIGQPQIALRH